MTSYANTVIVCLPGMESFARSLAHLLGVEVAVPLLITFADGEYEIRFSNPELLAKKHVVVVGTMAFPSVHESSMQLLLLCHEILNARASSIIACIGYCAYARHDTPVIGGGESSFAFLVKLLSAAGVHALYAVELHNPSMISKLSLPVYSISVASCIAEHIQRTFPSLRDICLVAPDEGAHSRVKEIASMLGVGYLFFIKERYATDKTRVVSQEGGCSGSIAIVIDDIIDTAGTAIQVSNILQTQGFKTIVGYFVHPVLSDDAVQRIIKSPFKQVYVSNTIPMQNSVSKIAVFDIVNAVCDFLTRHIA